MAGNGAEIRVGGIVSFRQPQERYRGRTPAETFDRRYRVRSMGSWDGGVRSVNLEWIWGGNVRERDVRNLHGRRLRHIAIPERLCRALLVHFGPMTEEDDAYDQDTEEDTDTDEDDQDEAARPSEMTPPVTPSRDRA